MSSNELPVMERVEGRVGIIELNRPHKHNCISAAVVAGMTAALTGFERDSSIGVVLLCASGVNFSTGADLQDVGARRADPVLLRQFLDDGLALQKKFEQSRLPIVVAVQGLCLAGGLEMALACDVVFCSRSARLGDQHARFGLLPGWGGSQRLPRIVGLRRALDLFLSGRWLDAQTAYEWGLVNYVVEDVDLRSEALAYCANLGKLSLESLSIMKSLARRGIDTTLEHGLELETISAVDLLQGKAVGEGLAAFADRRPPKFVAAD